MKVTNPNGSKSVKKLKHVVLPPLRAGVMFDFNFKRLLVTYIGKLPSPIIKPDIYKNINFNIHIFEDHFSINERGGEWSYRPNQDAFPVGKPRIWIPMKDLRIYAPNDDHSFPSASVAPGGGGNRSSPVLTVPSVAASIRVPSQIDADPAPANGGAGNPIPGLSAPPFAGLVSANDGAGRVRPRSDIEDPTNVVFPEDPKPSAEGGRRTARRKRSNKKHTKRNKRNKRRS